MEDAAKIGRRKVNASHALLLDLVGYDRRVLDVGCGSGHLGAALKGRGCTVTGIELDPVRAEAAKLVLDHVVVGDVIQLDLIERFGKESFDVVVLSEVLQRLPDPVAALRNVRPLLDTSGTVVGSVPNVAHGSVRLSLLNGRFDYQPHGLLDPTHLRFFTRGSIHRTLREAGFVPVEMRRTKVGVFEAGVDLRREDFDEGVVDAVEGDPESTTYQFAFRAVPEDSEAGLQPGPSRSQPAHRTRGCRVGVWAGLHPDDVCDALLVRVTCAELSRRLNRPVIRVFSSVKDLGARRHDGGLAVEPLGELTEERRRQLADDLDCVIVAGGLPGLDGAEGGSIQPSRFLLEQLHPGPGPRCPVVWSAAQLAVGQRAPDGGALSRGYRVVSDDYAFVRAASASPEGCVNVPDPMILVPRALPRETLASRVDLLRAMRWFPEGGPVVVVETDESFAARAGEVGEALDAAVAGSDASVVLVQPQPAPTGSVPATLAVSRAMTAPVHIVPPEASADDIVAVIANATVFAASSVWAMAIGLAYGRPTAFVDLRAGHPLRWYDNASVALTAPSELAALLNRERFRADLGLVSLFQSKLDAYFDGVAEIADAAAAARPQSPAVVATAHPSEYVAALELAHLRMRERLTAERLVIARHLEELRRRHDADIDAVREQHAVVQAALRESLDGAIGELEALRSTRVLRILRPARAVYARLRGGRL